MGYWFRRMPHKLQLTLTITREGESQDFHHLGFEMVRECKYTMSIEVKNMADSTFPGGKVSLAWAEYVSHKSDIASSWPDIGGIPKLEPQKNILVGEVPWYPSVDGPCWFRVRIESVDKQPIQYSTQYKEFPGDNAYWFFHISNRESVFILRELINVRKKMH